MTIVSRGAALILILCRGERLRYDYSVAGSGSDIGIVSRGAALILVFCRGERL